MSPVIKVLILSRIKILVIIESLYNILVILGIKPRADLLESSCLAIKLRKYHDINLLPISDHYNYNNINYI